MSTIDAAQFLSSASPALPAVQEITLANEQQQALDQILGWYDEKPTDDTPEYRLGGYAGTGKTTLIKVILSKLRGERVAVCAFTGKAADVLNRKGVAASTIHSLIYECEEDPITHELSFYLRPHLNLDMIIVDEASMLSTDLYRDLSSYGIPLLFVGDPGQLEPVGDNPDLMTECDYVLNEIHRQAMNSPIIQLASKVRLDSLSTTKPHRHTLENNTDGKVKFTNKRIAMTMFDDTVDQVICARNKTRQIFNRGYRESKKFAPGVVLGEKLICLQNNRKLGVFNGQMFKVTKLIDEDSRSIRVEIDGTRELSLWSDPFYREVKKEERPPKEMALCDYGYCITCHKSQGSEWQHVLLIDEWMPPEVWSMARWRYTGITRAAERLTFACL